MQNDVAMDSKDLSLEAVRGIASLVVFVWHFFVAFDPDFLLEPSRGIVGLPFYAFLHGTAAVDLFFLLSGFVLTHRFFETHDGHLLVKRALKRWFRLMPLALISVLMSWVCFRYGLYFYEKSALFSKSSWLFFCGGVDNPPVGASVWEALFQGTMGVFAGDVRFNSNLWTLEIEFLGSMIAFAFAWAVYKMSGKPKKQVAVTIASLAAVSLINLHYISFIVGPLLALALPHFRGMKKSTGIALILVGLFLLGYRKPVGAYAFMLPFKIIPRDTLYVFLSLVGGSMIIMAVSCCEALNKRMQNAVSRALGSLSFPLYAIHIVMICSLGSAVFAAFAPDGRTLALQMTALVLVPTTVVLAFVLALVDKGWLRVINGQVAVHYPYFLKVVTPYRAVRQYPCATDHEYAESQSALPPR